MTGTFWNTANPKKPTCEFDPNEVLDIPVDWTDRLADLSDTYASHTIEAGPHLEVVQSGQLAGVVTARIKASVTTPPESGETYPVTWHITTTTGQKADQTLYFKIRNK